MYGPDADSELSQAVSLLPRLPANSLLIADRNFGVFNFIYAAQVAGHDTLTRLTRPRFQALKRSATKVRPGRWKLEWTPSRDDRKTNPRLPLDAAVPIWLHEWVGANGQTILLATTCDRPTGTLARMYARRIDVETDIRQWKRTLDCVALRGQSAAMIEKELALSMVAYNLVVQVRRLAAARAKVPPRRLSFTGAWSLVTTVLLAEHAEWTATQWEEYFEWVLRGVAQRKVANRPGRSYPRAKLSRRRGYPERQLKT
jgi:hypothetical protein